MPEPSKAKVGLISCSGEELPCGTAAREATLRVLEKLRPHHTVTLCLPLFLAGEERERAFARFFPTVSVDGCARRCAARATEKFSAPPSASVVVEEVQAELGLAPARRLRGPEEAREKLVQATAEVLAREVDRLLGREAEAGLPAAQGAPKAEVAACACGSGIPVLRVQLEGQSLELLALPAVFEQLSREGVPPDADTTGETLLKQARIYNDLPREKEPALRSLLAKAYREHCQEKDKR